MVIKYFLLSAVLLVSLSAKDLMQIYQIQGMQAVEEALDERLATKEYWSIYLEDKNVTYGLFNDYSELLFCDKQEGALNRLSIDKDHTLTLKTELNTLIGGAQGDKHYEGDLKTPVGVYNLRSRIDKPAPFYGPLALVTNYPNKYDLAQNKSGSGIWIHGKPLDNAERDAYTKGCLVIENQEILQLNQNIDFHKTALVISPHTFPTTTKDTVSTILSELFEWRNEWKHSSLKPYLSFYHPEFRRSNGMSLTQFSIIKQNIFHTKEKRRINFKSINVIPYPNDDNRSLFYISLTEEYDAGHIHFNGKKELYVELINDTILILTEN